MPEWGSAYTPFRYILPADRLDGVEYPKDPDATYLPPARVVSRKIHRDSLVHDHSVTVMLIACKVAHLFVLQKYYIIGLFQGDKS